MHHDGEVDIRYIILICILALCITYLFRFTKYTTSFYHINLKTLLLAIMNLKLIICMAIKVRRTCITSELLAVPLLWYQPCITNGNFEFLHFQRCILCCSGCQNIKCVHS